MSERAHGECGSGGPADEPDASAVAAAVLEDLPLAVLVRDLEGRVRYVNAVARRWLREAGPDLLGSVGDVALPADQIAGFLGSDQRALRSAESQADDGLRWNPSCGRGRLVRTVKRCLVDPTDASTGVVVVLFDITEDNALVVAPQQAQERLGSIIESALDAIITCDSAGRVLIFNAAAERMFGLRREDILGQSLDQLVPSRHRGAHLAQMRDFSRERNGHRRMSGPGRVFGLRADGREFPAEASISHVSVDGEDLLSVVLRDISETVAKQDAINAARAAADSLSHRLALALESAQSGVWEYRLDDDRLLGDARMDALFGLPQGSFAGGGVCWATHLHPDEVTPMRAYLAGVGAGSPATERQFRIRRADDQAERYLQCHAYRETGPHVEHPRLVGMARDVTEQVLSARALEDAKQDLENRVAARTAELVRAKELADAASKAKSHFLANMSHELRTPLHSILGFTTLLADDGPAMPEAQRLRFLQRIRRSGEVLLGLVNGLLDMAKIEAGKLTVEWRRFDLAGCLEEVLGEFEPQFASKGLRVEGERIASLPLHGDAARIGQVIRNVLANAVRHGPAETALLVDLEAGDGEAVLRIGDRGPGVPEPLRERIFEPFSQGEQVPGSEGGAGLGLPISRGIVALHGGSLCAAAREGGGALFTMRLPLRPAGTSDDPATGIPAIP